jgi:hypothetical protein
VKCSLPTDSTIAGQPFIPQLMLKDMGIGELFHCDNISFENVRIRLQEVKK